MFWSTAKSVSATIRKSNSVLDRLAGTVADRPCAVAIFDTTSPSRMSAWVVGSMRRVSLWRRSYASITTRCSPALHRTVWATTSPSNTVVSADDVAAGSLIDTVSAAAIAARGTSSSPSNSSSSRSAADQPFSTVSWRSASVSIRVPSMVTSSAIGRRSVAATGQPPCSFGIDSSVPGRRSSGSPIAFASAIVRHFVASA